jgi:GT2 family glycosyltransferase
MTSLALPDSGRPDVAYAIVLTREAARARRCLKTVAQQDIAAEVFLVLNDPDDGIRRLAAAALGAHRLTAGVDLGVVFAWDAVLEQARAPAVLFLHEDAYLRPGAVARLLDTLREDERARAVGAQILSPDGSPQSAGAVVWDDGATTRIRPPLHEDRAYVVDYASSACLLVDREALATAGGLDAHFFPALYVDADLGTALWHRGHTVLCDPRAVAVHEVGAMVRCGAARGERWRQFLAVRNRERFAAKWGATLAGFAPRRDPNDASHPEPDEVFVALKRTRERVRCPPGPPVPPVEPIDRADREGHARRLRARLDDEFVRILVDREAELEAELRRVHVHYAALRREHDLQRERAERAEASLAAPARTAER